jgi:hypothetical protein
VTPRSTMLHGPRKRHRKRLGRYADTGVPVCQTIDRAPLTGGVLSALRVPMSLRPRTRNQGPRPDDL